MVDSDETRAGKDAERQPRLRLPLATMHDVRRELARIYREGRSGHREVADVSKLANVLQILSRVIEGSELERRVQALEDAAPSKGRF